MLGGRGPAARRPTIWARRRLLASRRWRARQQRLSPLRGGRSLRKAPALLAVISVASLIGALLVSPAVAADPGTWRGTITTTAHYTFDHPEGTVHRDGDAN